MKRQHLMLLDFLLLLGTTNLTFYFLSRTKILVPLFSGTIVSTSVLASLTLYYFYYITQNRRLVYLPSLLVLPVLLGNSRIGWNVERYYVETEFVWSEFELIDITHMTRLSFEYFEPNLSSNSVTAIILLITSGVLAMIIVDSQMVLLKEMEKRGVRNHMLTRKGLREGFYSLIGALGLSTFIFIMIEVITFPELIGGEKVLPGLAGVLILAELVKQVLGVPAQRTG